MPDNKKQAVFSIMKNICIMLLSVLVLAGCSTTTKTTDNQTDNQTVADNNETKSSWTYYSEALYYKNLAINSKDPEETKEYYKKAIELFASAEKTGEDKARIYYHLSDIYYMTGSMQDALRYATMSIEADREYYPPYERLYFIRVDNKEYEEAAAVMENYLKVAPDDLNVLYNLGIHYYRYLNDGPRSLAKFERIIRLAKTSDMPIEYIENAYYVSGYIYYTQNNFKKSAACYKKAYEIDQNNMVAVSMLALCAMAENNLKDAEKYALIYLESNPGELNMIYILAQIYYMNGDPKAAEYLAKIMKSKTFEGFFSSGLYYEIKGEDDKAENILRSVIKMKDDLLPAYIALSNIIFKKGDKKNAYKSFILTGSLAFRNGMFDVADRLFFKALQLKEDSDTDIYYYLARTQEEKKNFSMAISYYNKYYNATKEPTILVQIGYLYGVQKKYDKAYEYFDRAATLDPSSPVHDFFRGLVQLWEEKYSEANLSFKNAIGKKEDEELYYFYHAITWEKMQKYDNAIESLKLAIKYNPTSARSLNYLAYLYADKNMKLDEAYKLVVKALEAEPENGAYLDTLGWIYYRQGKYELALDYIILAEEKLAEENANDPVVYDHLGDIYIKLGKKDKALDYWQKAFSMNGDKVIEEKIRNSKNEK